MLCVVLCPGTTKGSTGSGSGFKASRKTGQRLKVSSNKLGEAGNRLFISKYMKFWYILHTKVFFCYLFFIFISCGNQFLIHVINCSNVNIS